MKILLVVIYLTIGVNTTPTIPTNQNIETTDICQPDSDHFLIHGCDSSNKDKRTNRMPKASILDMSFIYLEAKPLQVQNYTYRFPKHGFSPRNITCLIVRDSILNRRGACPILNYGGAGFHETAVELISQRGEGMKFYIILYGV